MEFGKDDCAANDEGKHQKGDQEGDQKKAGLCPDTCLFSPLRTVAERTAHVQTDMEQHMDTTSFDGDDIFNFV